ncbi:hypothetical protein [endosymbiont GvMRE of Glomus versiforme]|uniref:hypothetical protein n=1 Tax=endosymbiont GvMRE of Glomus versiforme TaxID=2039283 RepID=UPI000ED7C4D3|nr:hypothetical protein [endosymbiont GvMRE of Glomus versiforme]RHZ37186.1 hypothetical protein GvMRE_I1g273 [endosymbiont GvMRE of Glomus versiforme]
MKDAFGYGIVSGGNPQIEGKQSSPLKWGETHEDTKKHCSNCEVKNFLQILIFGQVSFQYFPK